MMKSQRKSSTRQRAVADSRKPKPAAHSTKPLMSIAPTQRPPLDSIPLDIPLNQNDWRHAKRLLRYLSKCHTASLDIPGIEKALTRTKHIGIHCADPAYRFIGNILHYAEKRCEHELQRCPQRKQGARRSGAWNNDPDLGRKQNLEWRELISKRLAQRAQEVSR